MYQGIEVADETFWIGTNDYETSLFENIWPLPRGVSYNSYLIKSERVAIIDAVKKSFVAEFLANIRSQLGKNGRVDYLIVNHMEPDHSGAVEMLRQVFPEMTIVGNRKTADFLRSFYSLEKNVRIVADGEALQLGRHTLRFYLTPMVHWPETMMTLDESTGVLFSGDAFGGFGALPGGIFDDEVDMELFEEETLRYFSNIVGKYAAMVQRAIEKLQGAKISVVASTHGPIWRRHPEGIIERYAKWSRQETEPGAVIVYGSMYGNTEAMVESVARGLMEAGIKKVRIHNVPRTHPSFILNDIWRFRALIFGAPTYNTKLFPPMDDLMGLVTNMKLTNRIAGIVGTFGWSGGAVAELRRYCEQAGYALIEPIVEAKCAPGLEDLDRCRQLGRKLAEMIKRQ